MKAEFLALDVSDHFEICALDPAPFATMHPKEGFIYAHKDGPYFLRASNDEMTGFVCIKAAGEYSVGKLYFDIGPMKWFAVGQADLKPIDGTVRVTIVE